MTDSCLIAQYSFEKLVMGTLSPGQAGLWEKGLISSPLITSDTPSVLLCFMIMGCAFILIFE